MRTYLFAQLILATEESAEGESGVSTFYFRHQKS